MIFNLMKLFNPPRILIDPGTSEWVLLGGEVLMLAIDSEKNLYNMGRISASYMRGVFDPNIPDQIKDFEFEESDDEATVDLESLAERIINGIDQIIKQKLIFVGLGAFEGNAFSTEVFRSFDISMEDINNLFKKLLVTLKRGFPILQKGNYINTSVIGQAASIYEFKDLNTLSEIDAYIQKNQIESIGIVSSSQGAANIFLLNSQTKINGVSGDISESNNLQTIRNAMSQGQITPISWVKFNLGINSYESLSNWEDFSTESALMDKFQNKMHEYRKYVETLRSLDINPDSIDPVDPDSLTAEDKSDIIKKLDDCVNTLKSIEPNFATPDPIKKTKN